jgi:hypothetical protein
LVVAAMFTSLISKGTGLISGPVKQAVLD